MSFSPTFSLSLDFLRYADATDGKRRYSDCKAHLQNNPSTYLSGSLPPDELFHPPYRIPLLNIYIYIYIYVCLFVCLFVYLFICLFVYLFICLFVYLFIYYRYKLIWLVISVINPTMPCLKAQTTPKLMFCGVLFLEVNISSCLPPFALSLPLSPPSSLLLLSHPSPLSTPPSIFIIRI